MRYLFGFVCVCALGMMPLVGCNEAEGIGGHGGAGGIGGEVCQAPLSDYWEGAECPTWEEAVAHAEELGAAGGPDCEDDTGARMQLYSGPCGDLGYISWGNWHWGYDEYFDASGKLVAAYGEGDTPIACDGDGTSRGIWYGSIPDCVLDLPGSLWSRDIWENFCKGSGYEYCAAVAECGAISESECFARYNTLSCWWDWEYYVRCFSDGGTCEGCADKLANWEACARRLEICAAECPNTESNPRRYTECHLYADGDCAVVDYCHAECASRYVECMMQDGVCPSP
jgi:hypothetical protein